MTRPSLRAAAIGGLAAIVAATVVNAALTVLAGDTLRIPGELGVAQVVMFTLAMAVPTVLVLWLVPRFFVPIVLAVAVLTLWFPYDEFGPPVAWWLGTMHLITGICAALIGPRVAARSTPA